LLIAAGAVFASEDVRSRPFELNYGATLTGLPEVGKIRIWLPVPRTNEAQTVRRLPAKLPAEARLTTDPKYGNELLYFEHDGAPGGRLAIQTSYQITRREVRSDTHPPSAPVTLTEKERALALAANRRVPIDGRPTELLTEIALAGDVHTVSRALYDRVDRHVRYDKSQPGYGNGDVLWVCDSRFGNCTDFHSLFLSLARSQGIPARFEIGFPLPAERGRGAIGGYHCWAWFFADDRGWVPVDISEADKHPELKDYYFGNLTENRVAFTIGRDIDLVPQQAGEPLNYFIYPYVEVDGRPLPKEQVELAISYDDAE
jgi:transglutaminase-like putative cysteine protease